MLPPEHVVTFISLRSHAVDLLLLAGVWMFAMVRRAGVRIGSRRAAAGRRPFMAAEMQLHGADMAIASTGMEGRVGERGTVGGGVAGRDGFGGRSTLLMMGDDSFGSTGHLG